MRLTKYIPTPFHMMAPEDQLQKILSIRLQRKVIKPQTARRKAITKKVKTHKAREKTMGMVNLSALTPEQLRELASKLEGLV